MMCGIATSMSHSLALKDDGTVVSFDENAGDVAPVPAGLSNVVAIAVDESVPAWCLKGTGLLRHGVTIPRTKPLCPQA